MNFFPSAIPRHLPTQDFQINPVYERKFRARDKTKYFIFDENVNPPYPNYPTANSVN